VQPNPWWPFGIAVVAGWNAFRGFLRRDAFADALLWPTTVGVVAESRIEEFTDSGGTPSRMFRVLVSVEYVIDGKEYRTRRYGSQEVASSWRATAESTQRRYPLGGRVGVHVNPANAADAIVDPKIARGWADVETAISGLMALGAIAWSVWLFRNR
jgi:hypothetical protein